MPRRLTEPEHVRECLHVVLHGQLDDARLTNRPRDAEVVPREPDDVVENTRIASHAHFSKESFDDLLEDVGVYDTGYIIVDVRAALPTALLVLGVESNKVLRFDLPASSVDESKSNEHADDIMSGFTSPSQRPR